MGKAVAQMTPEQREQKRATGRAYYLANRERLKAQNRQWALAHPERMREYGRNWWRRQNSVPNAIARAQRERAEHARRGLDGEVVLIELFTRRPDDDLLYVVVDASDEAIARSIHWSAGSKNYAVGTDRSEGRKRTVRLHRYLMGLTSGDGREVDHIDGNPLNCRRANMRILTSAENAQNRKKHAADRATSRYRGVSLNRATGRWVATCCIAGRQVRRLFASEEEAAAQAQRWRDEHMPFATTRDGGWVPSQS